MVNQLLGANGAVPGVRKPALSVSFGSGSAQEWQEATISVVVEASLCPLVDAVKIHLSPLAGAPSVAVGDTGSVSLGYADSSAEPVFSGQVESVRRAISGATYLVATNGGAALSRLKVNQSYEKQTAGEVVSNLASTVGVSAGTVEDGLTFPYYVADNFSSAYQHIARLATRSGYLAFFTPAGTLEFKPFATGEPVQTFTYGADILSLSVSQATPWLGKATVTGEGASGSQGDEAWSWLLKDPTSVTATAGQEGPELQISDPSLRSREAVQMAADALASSAAMASVTGALLVPGAPLVAVGSAIEIAQAPDDTSNGLFLVTGLRHRFSKGRGFTTLAQISKVGAGGLGGLL